MDQKIVKEFEEKEMKYRGQRTEPIERGDHILHCLTDNVLYMLLSSNGSYRIKYKMSSTLVTNMSDIQGFL